VGYSLIQEKKQKYTNLNLAILWYEFSQKTCFLTLVLRYFNEYGIQNIRFLLILEKPLGAVNK